LRKVKLKLPVARLRVVRPAEDCPNLTMVEPGLPPPPPARTPSKRMTRAETLKSSKENCKTIGLFPKAEEYFIKIGYRTPTAILSKYKMNQIDL